MHEAARAERLERSRAPERRRARRDHLFDRESSAFHRRDDLHQPRVAQMRHLFALAEIGRGDVPVIVMQTAQGESGVRHRARHGE